MLRNKSFRSTDDGFRHPSVGGSRHSVPVDRLRTSILETAHLDTPALEVGVKTYYHEGGVTKVFRSEGDRVTQTFHSGGGVT